VWRCGTEREQNRFRLALDPRGKPQGAEKLQCVGAGKSIEQRGGLGGFQRGEVIEKLDGVRARNSSDGREAGAGLRREIGAQECGDVCAKVSHSVSKPAETDH